MGRSDRGRTVYIDARSELIGAAAVGVVGVALGRLGALPTPVAAVLVIVSLGAGVFAARRMRRQQAEVALVLRDSSASGSARKAVELVGRLLEGGASFDHVSDVADALTSRRRHPHTAMLANVRAILAEAGTRKGESETARRRRAVAACNEAVRRLTISRTQTIHALAGVLDELAATVDIVLLYGYSSVVCEGVVASAEIRGLPIWIVQDLQYGGDSVAEHKEAREALQRRGIKVEVISYDAVYTVLGHTGELFIRNAESRVLPLMIQRRVLSIIGCEAHDEGGTVLIPAQVAGVPSETARFAELASTASSDAVQPRLLVVGESAKLVDSCHALDKATQVPLPTTWWRKPLHYVGVVVPFSGRDVELVEAAVGAHNVVSDNGLIAPPPVPALPDDEPTAGAARLSSLDVDAYAAVVLDLDSVLINNPIVAYERLAELVAARGSGLLHFATFQTDCLGLEDHAAVSVLADLGLLSGQPGNLAAHLEWLAEHPELSSPPQPTFVNGAEAFLSRMRSRTNRVGVFTARSRDWSQGLLDTTFLGEVLVASDVMSNVDPTRAYRQFVKLAWVGIEHTLPALFVTRDEDVAALAQSAGHQGLLLSSPESPGGDLRHLSTSLIDGHADPLDQVQMSRATAVDVDMSLPHAVIARADLDADAEHQYLRLCRSGFPERSWDATSLRRRALDQHLVTVLTVSDPQHADVLLGVATLHEGTASGEAKLHWVVVGPDCRRMGVGRSLTLFAIAAAHRHGYERITLTTESSRTDAVKMYQSCGFIQE